MRDLSGNRIVHLRFTQVHLRSFIRRKPSEDVPGLLVGGPVHYLGSPRSLDMGRSTFVTSVARVITFTILSLHQLVFTMPGGCVMRMSNWRRSVFLSARCRTGLSDRFRFTTCRTSPRRTGYQRRSTPGLGQAVRGCPLASTAVGGDCYSLGYSAARGADPRAVAQVVG